MHVIQMSENEGEVIHIDARGRFMAVITSNNMIKIFDISKKEYKQLGVTRKFEMKVGVPLGEIKDISLNSDGKKLCILADQQPFPSIRIPDTKFYIYDIDMDNFMEPVMLRINPKNPHEKKWVAVPRQFWRITGLVTTTAESRNFSSGKSSGPQSKVCVSFQVRSAGMPLRGNVIVLPSTRHR